MITLAVFEDSAVQLHNACDAINTNQARIDDLGCTRPSAANMA
jgi:hypothetical protein